MQELDSDPDVSHRSSSQSNSWLDYLLFDSSLSEENEISSEEALPRLLTRNQNVWPSSQVVLAVSPPPEGTTIPLANRWQAKDFAITIPQTEVTPACALERIQQHPALEELGLKFVFVAQEEHANVHQHHLHLYIALETQLRTSDHTFFNFIANKQANVQRVRSSLKWLRYVNKGRGEKASSPGFNIVTYLCALKSKTSSAFTLVADEIIHGKRDIREITNDHSGFVLQNLSKVVKFIDMISRSEVALVQRPEFPGVIPLNILDTLTADEIAIFDWVHVSSLIFTRQSQHLRLSGDSGVGKTRLLRVLSKFFYTYAVPFNDKGWYDNFTGDHAFLLFDEFKSQMKIQFMNAFVDGSGVPLSRRAIDPINHDTVIPCIMMTNYSWIDAYPNALSSAVLLQTVERRWMSLNIPSGQTILTLCSWLESIISDVPAS